MLASINAIYKLLILYMMDSVDFSLSNAIISDFILQENLTDYFNLQIVFSELEEEGLITSSTTYKTTYYDITGEGRDALDCFHNEISPTLKNHVREYLKEHSGKIVEMLSVKSDYEKSGSAFIAHCSIYERNSLLASISIGVNTEEQARRVCSGFNEKSSEIYAYLIKTLMK